MALGSAALLILAFPSFNQPWCAWIALVPWLLMLRRLAPGAAFRWSWLIGFGFFLGSIWWMVHLTDFGGPMAIVGWLALCAVLALYFGAFGWVLAAVGEKRHRFLLFAPALWVALEYARSHLLTGFGWNLLAYSQAPWLPLIQLADLTGAWGMSFLVVLVNAAASRLIAERSRAAARQAAIAAGVVLAALGYGLWRMPQAAGAGTVRVAVVQGNIPQARKWDEAYRADILERYAALTRQAAKASPDLIIWPETSVPGFLGLDEELTQSLVSLSRAVDAPLLVGAPHMHLDGVRWRTGNGAALLHAGALQQWYDKLHLVPFGEFIPFERALPWLREVLPPIGEFVPGDDSTVFGRPVPFGVLICFEDLFPELARRFAQRGARLLLVITNDAWFGPTAAAYQHAQASTFRAVELRVPLARAANTGWSGCIDAAGRRRGSVRDAAGTELFVPGFQACDLSLPGPAGAEGVARSLYLAWGDWFAWLCIGLTAVYNQRIKRGERIVPRRAAR
ncbi:MAG: apolipoprotein N-acyltransferase [Candidatus Omnitrophica bacterium]|nr:apolipoprotein N-acyltransferase [Candidatus Omnitrophota bacterium]